MFKFIPKPDITAYELARLIPYLLLTRPGQGREALEKMTDDLKRHIAELPDDDGQQLKKEAQAQQKESKFRQAIKLFTFGLFSKILF